MQLQNLPTIAILQVAATGNLAVTATKIFALAT